MRVKDSVEFASALRDVAKNMNIPPGGGDWNATAKKATANAVKGRIRDAMEHAPAGEDFGRYGWAAQLETLLGNALVEQQAFESKQGLYDLGPDRKFDSESFSKICRTSTAIANIGPAVTGYVAIGIADNDDDAKRIKELDKVKVIRYRHFNIVGIGREATRRSVDLNDYWSWLIQQLSNSKLDKALATQMAADARLVNYRGAAVALLRVQGASNPRFYEGELVERRGSSTVVVAQSDYQRVFNRFV